MLTAISLPATSSAVHTAASRAISRSLSKNHSDDQQRTTTTRRVLVIDDDRGFRESFRFVLEQVHGCDVVEASAADSAEQMIATGAYFDLIFIDVQMPVKDGIALYKTLRAANVATPVVLMSALAQNRARVNKLKVPFFDKALDGESLGDIIARHGGSRIQ